MDFSDADWENLSQASRDFCSWYNVKFITVEEQMLVEAISRDDRMGAFRAIRGVDAAGLKAILPWAHIYSASIFKIILSDGRLVFTAAELERLVEEYMEPTLVSGDDGKYSALEVLMEDPRINHSDLLVRAINWVKTDFWRFEHNVNEAVRDSEPKLAAIIRRFAQNHPELVYPLRDNVEKALDEAGSFDIRDAVEANHPPRLNVPETVETLIAKSLAIQDEMRATYFLAISLNDVDTLRAIDTQGGVNTRYWKQDARMFAQVRGCVASMEYIVRHANEQKIFYA